MRLGGRLGKVGIRDIKRMVGSQIAVRRALMMTYPTTIMTIIFSISKKSVELIC